MKGEELQQKNLFVELSYLENKYSEVNLLFAIPNGGKRHPAIAKKMKATGTKAGVPDMFLPVPKGEHHGLFIELKDARKRSTKTGKLLAGKKPRPVQKEWIAALKEQGYKVEVCHGSTHAFETIKKYLESK